VTHGIGSVTDTCALYSSNDNDITSAADDDNYDVNVSDDAAD